MPQRLRFQPDPNSISFVTTRCIQGYLFMRPSAEMNLLIAGVLWRTQKRYEDTVQVYGYVFMSNHYHMILNSKDQASLSRFMQYFNGNLGRELARFNRWDDRVWQRKYSQHLILDEEALRSQFKYIFANSVKEGLVSHPQEWPGLHCYPQLAYGEDVRGEWIDRTALFNAKRRKSTEHMTERDFVIGGGVQTHRPPCWHHLSDEAFQVMMRGWADEVSAEYQDQPTLGVEAVLSSPILEPRRSTPSQRPLCHAGCPRLWRLFKEAYRQFRSAYLISSTLLHEALSRGESGASIPFPPGGLIRGFVPT